MVSCCGTKVNDIFIDNGMTSQQQFTCPEQQSAMLKIAFRLVHELFGVI